MVKLELGMSLEDFEARRELFEAKLTEKLGAQVRIASVTVLEEEARRKKRQTKKRYLHSVVVRKRMTQICARLIGLRRKLNTTAT